MLNHRGISTVIGAILMISIVMTGLSTLFWQTQQMFAYQETVQKKADEDFTRMSEIIEITYADITSDNHLNVTVTNNGPLVTHLVSLYLTNYVNGIPQWRESFPLNNYSAAGMSLYRIGLSLNTKYTLQQDGIYGIQIGTERGNIASFVYGVDLKSAGKAQPLTFTFDTRSFNYTTRTGDPQWQTISRPAWKLNGSSPGTTYILFWLRCTNNGAKDVILSTYSYLLVEQPFPSPDTQHSYEYERYFFIVDNRSTSASGGTIGYTDYSQVIPANHTDYETGVTRIVKFGATTIGGSTLRNWYAPYTSGWSSSVYGTTSPAFCHQYYMYIVVYWKYSGDTQMYSQYVPYALIWVN